MIAATMFSGIGAAEQAMHGWDWRWHAEIERFPSAVMAARHPRSINLGDVCAEDFVERALATGRPDVVVFGSPCQDFSVAGKRVGLDGARGNLALVALGVLARIKPRWFVFENVPGLLSSFSGGAEAERQVREGPVGARADCDEDRDLAAFLSLVSDIGYHGGWCVLDSQWRGVAQRRERLFFVGYAGDWRGPAAVLFEPEGLRGDSPPRREAGQRIAGTISARTEGGGGLGTDFDLAGGLDESARKVIPICESGKRANLKDSPKNGIGIGEPDDPMFALGTDSRHAVAVDVRNMAVGDVAISLQSGLCPNAIPHVMAFGGNDTRGLIDVATAVRAKGGTGHGDFESETLLLQPIPIDMRQTSRGEKLTNNRRDSGGVAPSLRAMGHDGSHANGGGQVAVAFQTRIARNGRGQPSDVVPALNGADAGDTSDMRPCIAVDAAGGWAVRRLMPTECEKLQGFPRGYTDIVFRGKPAADGPRYKALGNSMTVTIIRWILERIEVVDALLLEGRS
jgi:DNA (cytosine-5)-methyltransferase 1